MKILFFLWVPLLLSATIRSQTPGLPFFKGRFNAIYGSSTKTSAEKIDELLQLATEMKHYGYTKDSAYTTLLQKTGLLYYLRSDFRTASAYTEQAVQNGRHPAAGQASYDSSVVQSYYNLNVFYDSLHLVEKAYTMLDSCITYSIRTNTAYDVAIEALENKTDYLFDKGDYSFCILNALVGEGFIRNYYHGSDSIVSMNHFITSRINSLFLSNKIPLLENLLKEKITEFSSSGDTNYLGVVYAILAQLNSSRNDIASGLFYFNKAYQLNLRLTFPPGVCEDLTGLGKLYARGLRQYKKGLSFCERALKNAGNATDSLIVLRDMADIYSLESRYDKANLYFRKAFSTLGQGMDEAGLENIHFQFDGFNIYQNILDLITDKGTSCQRQFQATKNKSYLNDAINVFRAGDRFLTKLKEEMSLPFESNLAWRMDAHSLYEHAIEACYANNDLENGFYFFEKSRAILLNDQIYQRRHVAEADIAGAAQLDEEISQLHADIEATGNQSKPDPQLLKRLYRAITKREAFSNRLGRTTNFAVKQSPDTASLTIRQERKNLSKNGSLVEIFTGDSVVYTLVITPTDQYLHRIDRTVYDSLSHAFNSLLSRPVVFEKDGTDYASTAHRLYSLLFKDDPLPPGRVIISPDAYFFPFEALLMDEGTVLPHYFLEKYTTSYAYSARFLCNSSPEDTNGQKSLLGIAPVTFDPVLGLAALPGSDASLGRIKGYFEGAATMVKNQATRANFLDHFSDYTIIQLYTHASDSSFRQEPVIYFMDSALYLSQLMSATKPKARLIVLAACETARGRLYLGEGIFSFNRGFAALGIPAAMSNLWSVDNQSTYRLTELFYQYLARGFPTDSALQKAKLEFISTASKTRQFPYYWAATLLIGKSEVIGLPKATSFFFFWILLAGILLSAGFYFVCRRFY
jgi:hypothetical protein